MLNSPLVQRQAHAFAHSLAPLADDLTRVHAAYGRAYSRRATTDEITRALAFLHHCDDVLTPTQPDYAKRTETAWALYCQTLLASNEFAYVD